MVIHEYLTNRRNRDLPLGWVTYLLFCALRNGLLRDNNGLMTAWADNLRGRSIREIGLVYVVEGWRWTRLRSKTRGYVNTTEVTWPRE